MNHQEKKEEVRDLSKQVALKLLEPDIVAMGVQQTGEVLHEKGKRIGDRAARIAAGILDGIESARPRPSNPRPSPRH